MKKQNGSKLKLADEIFTDLAPSDMKGIFARIPRDLHNEVALIKKRTGKSLYDLVEKALKLLVSEYRERNPGVLEKTMNDDEEVRLVIEAKLRECEEWTKDSRDFDGKKVTVTINGELMTYSEDAKVISTHKLDKAYNKVRFMAGDPDKVILAFEGFSYASSDFEDHYVNISIFSLEKKEIEVDEIVTGGLLSVASFLEAPVCVILGRGPGYIGTQTKIVKFDENLKFKNLVDFEFDFEVTKVKVENHLAIGSNVDGSHETLDLRTGKKSA